MTGGNGRRTRGGPFRFDGLRVEDPPNAFGDAGAERRALALGNTATDQFVTKGFLAVLQCRDLGFDAAELVGQLTGRQVVIGRDGNDICGSLGRRECSVLGVRPGRERRTLDRAVNGIDDMRNI